MRNVEVPALTRLHRRISTRLRGRTDAEHVMCFNRGCFSVIMAIYYALMVPGGAMIALAELTIGLAITAAIFAHIVLGPDRSWLRRQIALIADVITICLMMHLGGALTACFYPLILWTILGNGFRFGRRSLLRATGVGTAAFTAMAVTTPFWAGNPTLAAGLGLGLVLLPLYSLALLHRLHVAKQQAEAASEAKTLFLASVSHELRTPLHAIIGMGSLLERAKLPGQPAELVGTIMSASRSLLDLINDLLQLSVAETSTITVESDEFDLLTLLKDVHGLIAPLAREKGMRVALNVGPRTPARLKGDARRIKEVLLNLSGNALKFTDTGGILIAASTVGQPGGGLRLRLEVADTGIGIAAEACEKIFQPFTQADRSIAQLRGGTGLGLAICKRVVETLGGTIGVQSRVGEGSTFHFELPIEAIRQTAEAATADSVDDPVTVLSVGQGMHGRLREIVKAWGLAATFIECGPEAIRHQLAAAAAANHRVLITLPASEETADALAAQIRVTAAIEVPPLVLIGAPAPGAGCRDLRSVVPTWVDDDFEQDDLRAALAVAEGLRSTLAKNAEAPASPAVAGPPAGPPRRQLSILVADDNRINQRVMTKILEAGGHDCKIVSDGEAALDVLEEGGIDIVLMDVNMPGMDGLEATRLFRIESLGQPRLPIIALTADGTPEMAERCRKAGMDGCLVKPVGADALLDILETAAPLLETPQPVKVSRPTLRVVQTPVLDQDRLNSLREIGGEGFIADLLRDFLDDARDLFRRLEIALAGDDISSVRAEAHALGSSAANVGALRLNQLSLTLERARAGEIRLQGRRSLREIKDAIDQIAAECVEVDKRSRV